MKDIFTGKLSHINYAANVFLALSVDSNQGTYIEIGAHKGRSISNFTSILKDKVDKLHVKGYDIFDSETSLFHVLEDNGKGAGNFNQCYNKLSKLSKRHPNVTFELIRGYTTQTLTSQVADWVYIDGGHSYETVKWDHQQLEKSKVIIFDDADLAGVNRYLWEIKDYYNIYSLYSRQVVIINDENNFDFRSVELNKYSGNNPNSYVAPR